MTMPATYRPSNALLIDFVCVHFEFKYSHRGSTQRIHTENPHRGSTQRIHTENPHRESTQRIHTENPHRESTQRIHTEDLFCVILCVPSVAGCVGFVTRRLNLILATDYRGKWIWGVRAHTDTQVPSHGSGRLPLDSRGKRTRPLTITTRNITTTRRAADHSDQRRFLEQIIPDAGYSSTLTLEQAFKTVHLIIRAIKQS